MDSIEKLVDQTVAWLAKNGFRVIGVELSEIAIQACFEALDVTPTRRQYGHFTCWRHGNMEIWCGDIFDSGRTDLCNVKVLYDNAALTALPADDRAQYVRHFSQYLLSSNLVVLFQNGQNQSP